MLRLRFERVRRGWSQSHLGQLAHITQPDISLIETGRLVPTSRQLDALARVLAFAPPTDALLKDVVVVAAEELATQGVGR